MQQHEQLQLARLHLGFDAFRYDTDSQTPWPQYGKSADLDGTVAFLANPPIIGLWPTGLFRD